jgi:hypothetical protein
MIRPIFLIFFLTNTVDVALGQEGLHIVNDQFAEHPFEIELSPSTIHKVIPGKITSEKKTTPNKHTADIDTLLIFKSSNDEFTFLKTIDKTWFVEALITSRNIRLAKGIRIGLAKSSFIKAFAADAKLNDTNPLIVTNSIEYGFYHSFYFEKGKLTKIVLNAWPD